jgi:tyrosine-protein kinase Etk/Wzc
MINNTPDFNDQEDSTVQKDQLKKLLYRIIPYLPLIILALMLGIICSKLYLRYAARIFASKTRLIVNDDTQQKNSNLLNLVQYDPRDASSETEREMEILRSRDLVSDLVTRLQLNVQYGQKGHIKLGKSFKDVPFKLELLQPDSVTSIETGEVELKNGKINFLGNVYNADTVVASKWGNMRWHINTSYKTTGNEDKRWYVTIMPVVTATDEVIGALSVKPISKFSSIVELTYLDEIPERGVNILDSLIAFYGMATKGFKSRISANTLNFLDERLRLVAEELNGEEKKLQSFKTTQGIVDLGAEGTLFLEQLKEADTKIGELDVKMDVLKQIEQYVTRRNNTNSQIPASLGTTDLVLTDLLNQLYEAEFDLEKTKQTSGSKNPQIEVYEEAISRLKPSIITSLNNLKLQITASRQQLLADNSKLTARLGKIPLKERLLLDISRQQGIKNAIYTFLLQKREESAITAAAILPNHRVIEKPENVGMVSPIATKIYAFGIFMALILSAIFIYFREFFNNRLLFRSQIESKLQVPIIAELAFQPNETGGPVVVGLENRSLIGEQFRELRTNLNYVTAAINEKCKVILITSSITGEGKSFVAINTAVSLSLTGVRVVLLEFDLRKPKISKELGIAREPGLSNYLINMATVKEITKAHPTIANFSIIPSGTLPPNPAELISSNRLNELVDDLKQNFDYVIIDSPPVGAVTDAKILASIAHTTLYIVRHNYTDSNLLQLLTDVQHRNILPNLNIVFNGITSKKILGYSYGKGYGYGYGMGYGYGYGEGYSQEAPGKK